jgi:hypothetical protein
VFVRLSTTRGISLSLRRRKKTSSTQQGLIRTQADRSLYIGSGTNINILTLIAVGPEEDTCSTHPSVSSQPGRRQQATESLLLQLPPYSI